jgi:hypothetical protein
MVDIHSMAASSHPSHREREATSRSRAGRSRRAGGRADATTVVLESQPQCTVGTTASPLVAAGIIAALLVVRQLLNNPPPSRASSAAAEQWRHDVGQLVATAINAPHQERQRQPPPQQSRVWSTARASSMASYTMTDLREEINH